jgi:hypothetical protein
MDEGALRYFTKMLENTVRHGQNARSAKTSQPKKSHGEKQGPNPVEGNRGPGKEKREQATSSSSRNAIPCPLQQPPFSPGVEVKDCCRISQPLPIAFDDNTFQPAYEETNMNSGAFISGRKHARRSLEQVLENA